MFATLTDTVGRIAAEIDAAGGNDEYRVARFRRRIVEALGFDGTVDVFADAERAALERRASEGDVTAAGCLKIESELGRYADALAELSRIMATDRDVHDRALHELRYLHAVTRGAYRN